MRKITFLVAALVLFSTSFAQLTKRVDNTPAMLTSVKSKSLPMPMNGAKAVVTTLNYDAANDDGIGTGQAADFGVYAKHPASVMTPLVGNYITQVEFYINGVTDVSAVEIRLYNDTLTPVFTQAATGLVEGWNTVMLNPSYTITAADLYVGYNVTCTGGYPAGNDAGPRNVNAYGDIMYFGKWTTANALSSTLDLNWNIRATVEDTAITCFPPTAVNYSNTTYNSTDIAWTSSSSAWNIKISSTVIDPNTGTGNVYDGSTATASYSATGLMELTDYYVYIQSDCGSSTTSSWLTSGFTTPKDCSSGITAPWSDDMTAGIGCWVLYDVDGDGFNWYNGEVVTGNTSLNSFSWDAVAGALTPDNWAVTNKINIASLTTPFLSWSALSFDPAYPAEKYSVYVSTTGNTPADFSTADFTETLVDDAVVFRNISLASYSGDIWIAFRHHGVSDMYGMYIDNVSVDNTVSIKDNSANAVGITIYPNPANALLNIKSDSRIVNVRVFNVIGQTVMVEKPNVTHAVLEINDLNDGLYYVEVETETDVKVKKITVTR